jgi:hypothetical protein
MTRCYWRVALLTGIVAVLAAPENASHAMMTPGYLHRDPAVVAYTAFIDDTELKFPADRDVVVAAVDRLASAIEGLALARGVLSDVEFARVHAVRRDVRYLSMKLDSPGLTRARAGVFIRTERLLADLERTMHGNRADHELLNAIERAADGLDTDYPLRWQPSAMNNFFRLAAKLLQELDH